MGLFHLGTVIKFIPYPIVVGFTAGIALTIFSTQINDFLGLGLTNVPSEFIPKWGVYFQNLGNIDLTTVIVGVISLLIIVLTPKISKKMPGALTAIIVVTVVMYFVKDLFGVSVETIGDRFGAMSNEMPEPHGFELSMATINQLMPSAFTIAVLCAIESLLSATVADGVTGARTNSNTELIGQGVANIAVPFFGGIPVTGAIARTMTNINNGGRTPVAGVIHAIVLLLILLFLSPLTKHIPMACLAGVLVVVSYNMSEWRSVRSLMHNPKSDVVVLLVTMILTVVFDLTIAIEVGLVLAIILFMRRVMESTSINVVRDQLEVHHDGERHDQEISIPKGVEVYEIEGPFFFGIANKFDEAMRRVGGSSKIRIVRMRKVSFIDSTGIHNLEIFIRSTQKEGRVVILSGVGEEVRATLEKAGTCDMVGRENVCDRIDKAIARAEEVLKAI